MAIKDNEKRRIAPLFRIINSKRVPICDYRGQCKNKAYKEVYPSWMDQKQRESSWSYLCKKHFEQEKKALKSKLSYCSI